MGGTGDGTKYTVHIELEAHDAVSAVVKKLAAEVEKAVNATQGIKGTPGGGGGGSGGEHPAKQIDRVRELSRAWGGLKSSFSGLFDPIRAAASAYSTLSSVTGLSIGGVITGAVGVSKSFEDMQLGMTAMLSSVDRGTGGPYARFADAQTKVTGLMKLMREESVKSAIGLDEIGDSFQTIMPMARGLGVSLEDLVKLSTSTAIADPLGNVARGTTVRDIRQILGGHVSAREIQNPLLRGGISEYQEAAHQYAELAKSGKVKEARDKQAEILQKIMKVLEQSPESMAARRGSLSGRMAELKNLFEIGFMEGTKPAYEMLKSVLGDAAKWVSEHPEKIKQAAADFAKFMERAATVLYKVFTWIYNNWSLVSTAIETFFKVWALAAVSKFIVSIGSFAKAVSGGSFVDMVKALAGLKVGPGGVPGSGGGAPGVVASSGGGFLGFLKGIAKAVPLIAAADQVWESATGTPEKGALGALVGTKFFQGISEKVNDTLWYGVKSERSDADRAEASAYWDQRGYRAFGAGVDPTQLDTVPSSSGGALGAQAAAFQAAANRQKAQTLNVNINVKSDGTADATATSPDGNIKPTVRGVANPMGAD